MAYTPKQKNTRVIKIAIIVLVISILSITFGVVYVNKQEAKAQFKICGLTHDQSVKKLSQQYDRDYLLQDYLFYGESLNLFQQPYNIAKSDEIAGKSIILKDMCSDQEYSFVIRNKIDSQIILNSIKEGYYEIFVVEDLREKRLYFDREVEESIVASTRHGKNLRYTLSASTTKLKDKGIDVEKAYAFLQVTPTKLAKTEYDIAIDPGALDTVFTLNADKGSEGNGLIEYKEAYEASQLLKEALEAKGLKVLVLRNKEEVVDSYGEDGRLARAYAGQAKYYLRLTFSESSLGYSGMDVKYSAHANGNLAKQIIYTLKRESEVKISGIYNPQDPGLIAGTLLESKLDGRYVYDDNLWLREAGGKATQAGMYSENTQEGTAAFAKDNMRGMNAIQLNLGYLTDKEDVAFWKQHKEAYMQTIAKGIAIYLNIEE